MRHPSLYIRPLEPKDIAPVTHMLNAAFHPDNFSENDVRLTTFGDFDYDPELTLVALDGGAIIGFTHGVIRTDGNITNAAIKWFATSLAARRKHVMTTLFNRIEHQIHHAGVTSVSVGFSPPNYVYPGVPEYATDAIAFLLQRGYKRTGSTHTLKCDTTGYLHATLEHEFPWGVTYTRARRSDLQPVLTLVRNEFPAWTTEVAACFRKNPIGLFVAREENELIGFASTGGYASGRGWIGPTGVTLAQRNRGIGTRLLHIVLNDLHAAGHVSAIVPADYANNFFQKSCNVHLESRYLCFTKYL